MNGDELIGCVWLADVGCSRFLICEIKRVVVQVEQSKFLVRASATIVVKPCRKVS